MSFLEIGGLTEALLQLKSAIAVKIAHLLVKAPGETFAATYPLLRKLLNCGPKALQNAMDELTECGWVEIVFKDTILTLKITAAPTVHPVHKGVSSGDNLYTESAFPVSAEKKPGNGSTPPSDMFEKPQNPAGEAQNPAEKTQNPASAADLEEEEEDNKSSSSSLKSGKKSNIYAINRKNSALRHENDEAGDEFKDLIKETLGELGMTGDYVFRQVEAAAEGLPIEAVRETLKLCILHNPRTPAYLVKALTAKKSELASRREAQSEDNLARNYEIKLGERLLDGQEVKFEQLGQSKHWKRFARPLFDPLTQKCRLQEEYREELMRELAKMREEGVG